MDEIKVKKFLDDAYDILKDVEFIDEVQFGYDDLNNSYGLVGIMLSHSHVMMGNYLMSLLDGKIKIHDDMVVRFSLTDKLHSVIELFKKNFKNEDLRLYHNKIFVVDYKYRKDIIEDNFFVVMTKNYLLEEE